ncbi:hypothetical protein SAMN05216378_2684 [Paenibacillus catalpae]|uniref:Uncharacterized protein n=1 Tax=Paenibacillus catalpae TaxID=1045775 RepID=A0A1I1YKB8_9BACL|nr:hypothetical protein [Paenibacillus catalpae]SFE19839.1 hypothetical protein SAMN05216378_2684 [Paenibacillus catalpae]
MNLTEEECEIAKQLLRERIEDVPIEGDTEVELDEVLMYISSDINVWKKAKTNKQLTQVYNLHRPVKYDIYLDLSKGEWLARGEAMNLSADDIRVLFRMIKEGLSCTSQMIFQARYNQELEPGNKKDRGRLDSYYRKLKERLKLYGITTERYTVKLGTRCFVIYPEAKD